MDENRVTSTTVFVAITAIATTILYAAASSISTKQDSADDEVSHDDRPLSDDDVNDNGTNPKETKAKGADLMMETSEQEKMSTKVAPFPWEIEESSENASSNNKEEENPVMVPNRHHDSSSQSQLDFLASMTFANGGLRSPSCPCCI